MATERRSTRALFTTHTFSFLQKLKKNRICRIENEFCLRVDITHFSFVRGRGRKNEEAYRCPRWICKWMNWKEYALKSSYCSIQIRLAVEYSAVTSPSSFSWIGYGFRQIRTRNFRLIKRCVIESVFIRYECRWHPIVRANAIIDISKLINRIAIYLFTWHFPF